MRTMLTPVELRLYGYRPPDRRGARTAQGRRTAPKSAGIRTFAITAVLGAISLELGGAQQVIVPVFTGVTANTLTKAPVAFISGRTAFAARAVPGLALMLAALWMGFF